MVRTKAPMDKKAAVERYMELRPVAVARLRAIVPPDLRSEFEAVTPRQLQVLSLIPPEGTTMHELARALGISAPTVSTLADRLVNQGLAERRHDGEDRRVVRLVTSTKGREVTSRYASAQRRIAEEMFGRLSDAQARALVDLVETLAHDPSEPMPARELEDATR